MERHFALPITFAATLHLAVLFGPRLLHLHDSTTRTVDNTKPKPADTILFQLFPEPQPEDEAEKVASNSREPPSPTLPEQPAPATRDPIPVPIPPRPTTNPNDETVIHLDLPGIPGDLIGGDGPPRAPIVDFTKLDNTPRPCRQVQPLYPQAAKQSGLGGDVLVEFTVDESGAVIEPRVVRSSDRVFEEPALRAVSRWQFEPGRRDGRTVRFRMALPLVFSMSDS
jgi:protein TonB